MGTFLRRINRTNITRNLGPFHSRLSSTLKQRSIVSSFICTAPGSPSGFAFALFKRSQNVSVYKGKWAVCSGSIKPSDASPVAAAQREILEETELSESDIVLLRKGEPYSLKEKDFQTEWIVHPFAWQLKDGAKQIKLEGEHTEVKFVKPEELELYDHVPNLEIGLGKILEALNGRMERGRDLDK